MDQTAPPGQGGNDTELSLDFIEKFWRSSTNNQRWSQTSQAETCGLKDVPEHHLWGIFSLKLACFLAPSVGGFNRRVRSISGPATSRYTGIYS